jgi:hypothetical protein
LDGAASQPNYAIPFYSDVLRYWETAIMVNERRTLSDDQGPIQVYKLGLVFRA